MSQSVGSKGLFRLIIFLSLMSSSGFLASGAHLDPCTGISFCTRISFVFESNFLLKICKKLLYIYFFEPVTYAISPEMHFFLKRDPMLSVHLFRRAHSPCRLIMYEPCGWASRLTFFEPSWWAYRLMNHDEPIWAYRLIYPDEPVGSIG